MANSTNWYIGQLIKITFSNPIGFIIDRKIATHVTTLFTHIYKNNDKIKF